MSDWPTPQNQLGGGIIINTMSPLSLGPVIRMGAVGSPTASSAWPSANRAFFIPFRVPFVCTAYQMSMGGGTTASGNVDMGIYDEWGNRLTSSGAVAKPASTEIIGNITDVVLLPGLYYMAAACSATSNVSAFGPAAQHVPAMGVKMMNSAYTLPSTATFATATSSYVPLVAVWLRSE